MKKVDMISGAVLVLLSLVGFLYARATTTPSSVGLASNTYPQFLFICLGICGVVLVTTSFKKSSEAQINVNWKGLVPILLILLVYVLIFDYVHFIVSTIAFLAVEMFLFGERRWKVIAPVAVLAPIIIFYLFTEAFSIILPS